jgi:hypothetical protein
LNQTFMNTSTTLAAAPAKDSALQAYEQVAAASNEVAGLLAKRLKTETQGEVLFSAADRGRYATDASIYQVTPLGVFVPQHATVPSASAEQAKKWPVAICNTVPAGVEPSSPVTQRG